MSDAQPPYQVTISFEDGAVQEGLMVTRVGQNTYRLEVSAIFGEPKYHDLIETEPAADGTHRFVRVCTRRLRHSCWCLARNLIESPEIDVFLAKVVSAGGYWEIHFGGILLLHLPRAKHSELMREFDAVAPSSSAGRGIVHHNSSDG